MFLLFIRRSTYKFKEQSGNIVQRSEISQEKRESQEENPINKSYNPSLVMQEVFRVSALVSLRRIMEPLCRCHNVLFAIV